MQDTESSSIPHPEVPGKSWWRRLAEQGIQEIDLGALTSLRLVWLTAAWLMMLRFVLTSLFWAQNREFIILLVICAGLGLLAFRFPDWRLPGSLVLIPIFSELHLAFQLGTPSLPFLGVALVALFEIPRILFSQRLPVRRVPALVWLAECVGLALVVKAGVGLATPSPVNALTVLMAAPVDPFMVEFQGIDTLLYLGSIVLLFEMGWAASRLSAIGGRASRWALVGQILLVGLFVLLQQLGLPPIQREATHAPFNGIHELGGYGAIAFGFCFVQAAARSGSGTAHRISFGLLSLLALLITVLSFSRTAWLGLMLVTGLVILQWFGWKRVLLPAAGALILLFLASPLLQSLQAERDEPDRILQFLDVKNWAQQSGNQIRLALYEKAGILIRQRPLDGVGLGDFRMTDTPDSAVIMEELPRHERYIHRAHNLFLNLMADGGVPLALLFAGFFLMVANAAFFPGKLPDPWPLAILSAMLMAMLVNLFNDLLYWPCQSLIFAQALLLLWIAPATVRRA